MENRRELVERDFGLRPQPPSKPKIRIIFRRSPSSPENADKPEISSAETSSPEISPISDSTDGSEDTSVTSRSDGGLSDDGLPDDGFADDEEPIDEEPVDEEPVEDEPVEDEPVDEEPLDEEPVDHELVNDEPVNEDPAADRSAAVSPPETSPTLTKGKAPKRRRSDEAQRSGKDNDDLPPGFPPCPMANPDRFAIDLWRQGCRTVQRPDGDIDAGDVISWLMTRKGGINNRWPQLEEGQSAIKNMRKDPIDFEVLTRQPEEMEEAARLKEERRLANKRRYRPRGQVAKERAEKRAAAAAAAAAQAETKNSQAEAVAADNEEPQAKKARIDVAL